MARSGGGTSGWRGDGNDDEDVAIVETSVYVAVAEMALQNYSRVDSSAVKQAYNTGTVDLWLTSILLP